jgi:hypothetical protein
MKRLYVFLSSTILLLSCSVSGLGVTVTPPPVPTNTHIEIPTATPTIPTPTFTNTPTLIVIPRTETATAEVVSTQELETPLFLFTPNTSTPSPKMKGFISVLVSEKEFYKGNKCQPYSVKFTAQVSDPIRSAYVVLFVRFKSKRSGVTSEWTSIKMDNLGAGTFAHELTSEEMKGLAAFQNAWVQYQLVTTQSNTNELGRTDIFSERLTLLECTSTPTPDLSATPVAITP